MIEEYRSNVLLHYLIFRNNDRNRNFSRSKKKKRILTFRPTIRVTIHFNPILEIRIRISPRIFTKFFYIVYHVPCFPNKRKEKTLSRFFNHSLFSSKFEEARNEGGHPRILESTGRNIMKPPSIYRR